MLHVTLEGLLLTGCCATCSFDIYQLRPGDRSNNLRGQGGQSRSPGRPDRQWRQLCLSPPVKVLPVKVLSGATETMQVDELKVKQREEYGRLGVMSDTLAFELDGNPG